MTTTYDELRQRVIDGDGKVTASELDKARREAEYDALQDEAAEAAAQREAEEQRRSQVEQLERDATALAETGLGHLQSHYRTAVDALRALRAGITEHNREASRIDRARVRLVEDHDEPLTWSVPRPLNLDFELDRLDSESRSSTVPWDVSRLHDEETRDLIRANRDGEVG